MLTGMGPFHNSQMQRVAAICVGVVLNTVPGLSFAALVMSDAEQREADAEDLANQRPLVTELAAEADTIAIARMIRETGSLAARFHVSAVLKGSIRPGMDATFTLTPSIPPIAGISATTLFRNTAAFAGQEYILYAVHGLLIRAAQTARRQNELPLIEELSLIKTAKASKNRSERLGRE
jgi:hypothetical protein